MALCEDSSIAPMLKEAGTNLDAIKRAAQQVRGGKQVNSRGAEEGFEALSKYAKDLTAEAEQGKLDPVRFSSWPRFVALRGMTVYETKS